MESHETPRTRPVRDGLLTLALTFIIWLVVSWPLPLHVGSAVPMGATGFGTESQVEVMMPGDHLQLMFHYWLMSDYIRGGTPWFYNFYEMNTGDDAERYEPGPYYIPFSLLFTIGYLTGNHSIGWNFAGFVSLWVTVWLTLLLCRRYSDYEGAAWLGAALSILLPYRWLTLFGGSPTGFGMMMVPLTFLGLDYAVRDGKWRGGWMAGLGILLAGCSDTHTFFFAVLFTPVWCLAALIWRGAFDVWKPRFLIRRALVLLPVPIMAWLAIKLSHTITGDIEASTAKAGRTLQEVALFSPHPAGLITFEELGLTNHIYIGFLIPLLLLAGLAAGLFAWKRGAARKTIVLGGLILSSTVVVFLSLGPFGPFDAEVFILARQLIPPYELIRQPAKIFSVLPILFAVAGTIAVGLLARSNRRMISWGAGLAAVLILIEIDLQIHPQLSVVYEKEPAYEAVTEDARTRGMDPHLLVLPLWPGDSHQSSVYQHYASLYRIRMINGYRPFVPARYIRDAFKAYESANLGILSDAQLDSLRDKGIHHIILHENIFPEKVSPFPVTYTLFNLLNHPRLDLLKQSGPVWAFRIRDLARPEVGNVAMESYPPAALFEAERMRRLGGDVITDETASFGSYVRMGEPGNRLYLRPIGAGPAPGLRWMIRARGTGSLSVHQNIGEHEADRSRLTVSADDWTWLEVPSVMPDGMQFIYPAFERAEGRVDIDQVLLAAGEWPVWMPGDEATFRAGDFFHAGHIRAEDLAVVFDSRHERRGIVLYGPRMPAPPGRYEAVIDLSTEAERGSHLGEWTVESPPGTERVRIGMTAGEPVIIPFTLAGNHILQLIMVSETTDSFSIGDIHIKRLE